MQRYLFQISIGPVQNFIAAARRTRDLKFGSELLSELSKAAANAITTANAKNTLIFPAPPNPESLKPDTDFNVANKIVALLEEETPNALGETGEKVRKAVLSRLEDIRDETYKQLGNFDKGIANAQIEDLVEFFWVALPYSSNYKTAREEVEALMAARKNTRNFSPVTWGSQQDKSSIDGQLESVIPKEWYPHRWENLATQRKKADKLFTSFHAKPGEHLSGVDLLKRNGRLLTGDNFPSTSHFATVPFLQRLETLDAKAKESLKQTWGAYIKEIKKVADRTTHMPDRSSPHSIIGGDEGSMLLEERFSDLVDIVNDMRIFDDAKKALHKFFEQVDQQFKNASPKVRPGTYYAILLADGDSMGKVIDHEAEKGSDRHQQLSRKLAEFSESVRSIVESNHGSLIYAGGDDVLAFMPLHTVMQCAQKLSVTFCTALENFKDKDGKSPTLSVGVAIIHHLQPLREALKLARDAEKKAKQVKDKNALAIIISKRGGSDFTIRGQWPDWKQEESQPSSFAAHLNELVSFCRQESLPHGTAYELRDMALRLELQEDTFEDDSKTEAEDDSNADQPEPTMQTVIKTEAQRNLERKLTHHRRNNPHTNVEEVKKIHKRIAELLDKTHNIKGFADELIAAQFFADAMELAQPTKGAQ